LIIRPLLLLNIHHFFTFCFLFCPYAYRLLRSQLIIDFCFIFTFKATFSDHLPCSCKFRTKSCCSFAINGPIKSLISLICFLINSTTRFPWLSQISIVIFLNLKTYFPQLFLQYFIIIISNLNLIDKYLIFSLNLLNIFN
jgi:hypothetical protein